MFRHTATYLPTFLTGNGYDFETDARAHLYLADPAEAELGIDVERAKPAERATSRKDRRAAVIRPVRGEPISLARRRLERGEALVESEGHTSRFYHGSKRVFDVVGAGALLVALSPVLLCVYAVLMVTTGGKPFFTQRRLGYRGKPFTMIKFRTMTLDAETRRGEIENEKDGPIFKNRQDARVTRIGRFLRSTSLDETPQLINVLLGQMSLVGPRPPIGKEVAEYEPWQRRRLSVKPGLTCLWQVSGRSEIDFEDWMRMDLWYVRHQSWSADLKFLMKTPWSVLTGRGAY